MNGIGLLEYTANFKARIDDAKLAMRKMDFPSAIDILNGCLEKVPEDLEALKNRALCLLKQDDPERALIDFEAYLTKKPEDVEMRFKRGIAFQANRAFGNALHDYSTCLQIKKKSFKILMRRGAVYESLDLIFGARCDYTECLAIKKGDPEALDAIYLISQKIARKDKNLTSLYRDNKQSYSFDLSDAISHFDRDYVRRKVFCSVPAKKYFLEGFELLRKHRDYSGAKRHLKNYVTLEHKDPDGWYLLGLTHAKSDEYNQSLKALSKCIELDSNYVRALNCRAAVYIRLKFKDSRALAVKDLNAAMGLKTELNQRKRKRSITITPKSEVDGVD